MSGSARDITLVLGGGRSGKSVYVERRVTARPGPWVYCATAQALDSEMADRIAHQKVSARSVSV